jgi:hypothetical protein
MFAQLYIAETGKKELIQQIISSSQDKEISCFCEALIMNLHTSTPPSSALKNLHILVVIRAMTTDICIINSHLQACI